MRLVPRLAVMTIIAASCVLIVGVWQATMTATEPILNLQAGAAVGSQESADPSELLDAPGSATAAVSGQQVAGQSGAAQDVRPVRVRIPEIGVDAEVIDLGLNDDRTLEVPSDFAQTGWYTGRSVPGMVGPSVVVGHVDSTSGPAVFYRLRDLDPGHTVEIERSDGVVARYRITDKKLVDKDEFPTAEVYGSTDSPTLRLITCGGGFDTSARSYEGNLLVFAEHIENIAA